jgi:hypothetical protein
MCAAVVDPDNYFKSLGRFIHMYATVEVAVQVILWVHVRVDMAVAKALLNGTRVRDAIGRVNRIREATGIDERSPESEALKNIFTQIADITSARDDLVHYGTWTNKEGTEVKVSNWRHAYNDQRLREFVISAQVLDDMTADLEEASKRLLALTEAIAKRQPILAGDIPEPWKQPWRYKSSAQVIHPKQKTDKPPKQQRQRRP